MSDDAGLEAEAGAGAEPVSAAAAQTSAEAVEPGHPVPHRQRMKKQRRVLKTRQHWWERPRLRIAVLVVCALLMTAVLIEVTQWWGELPPPPEVVDPDAPQAG
jgi:hypothetical protein